MSGEQDLYTLLATLSPRLSDGEYVFCTFPGAGYGEYAELDPVACVLEAEGLTLVVPTANARAHGLDWQSPLRMITLGVHSSLDAVGLTAACARQLAARGISANVIAAYHHDHVFVPAPRALEALAALNALTCTEGMG